MQWYVVPSCIVSRSHVFWQVEGLQGGHGLTVTRCARTPRPKSQGSGWELCLEYSMHGIPQRNRATSIPNCVSGAEQQQQWVQKWISGIPATRMAAAAAAASAAAAAAAATAAVVSATRACTKTGRPRQPTKQAHQHSCAGQLPADAADVSDLVAARRQLVKYTGLLPPELSAQFQVIMVDQRCHLGLTLPNLPFRRVVVCRRPVSCPKPSTKCTKPA